MSPLGLSDSSGVARSSVAAALAEALSFVFPVACAACGEPGLTLCAACRLELIPVPQSRVLPSGLRVFSGLAFEGAAARVIRSIKADGRTGLARALAPALRVALENALLSSGDGSGDGSGDVGAGNRAGTGTGTGVGVGARSGGAAGGVVVVPVPTSRAAMRRRGYRVVEILARRAGVPPARLLHPVRKVADQRSLSIDARQQNVAGSMRARSCGGLSVVVVDDVVTTGATLDEACRALTAAGARVIAAATVAATPRRRQ